MSYVTKFMAISYQVYRNILSDEVHYEILSDVVHYDILSYCDILC